MSLPSKKPFVYLDACIFMAEAKKDQSTALQKSGARECCRRIEDGEWIAVASVVLRSELLYAASKQALVLFDEVRGTMHDVTYKIADVAAGLRLKFHLKSMDSIHLATAAELGCDNFITFDGKFSNALAYMKTTYGMQISCASEFQPAEKQLDLFEGQ